MTWQRCVIVENCSIMSISRKVGVSETVQMAGGVGPVKDALHSPR